MVKRIKRTKNSFDDRVLEINEDFSYMKFNMPVSLYPPCNYNNNENQETLDQTNTIVIDNGSFRVKAGFSSELAPRRTY